MDAIERSAKENVLIPPTAAAGLGPWSEVICAETIEWYSGKNAAVPEADKPDY